MPKILVCLDGSRYSKVVIESAVDIARIMASSVAGLFVVESKALEGFYSDVHFQAMGGTLNRKTYQNKLLDIFMNRGEQILDELEKAMVTTGLDVERIIVEGITHKEILEHSRYADLVIMGRRGEHAAWGGPLLGSTAETIIHSIRVPLLLTVESHKPVKRVLIAYDGTKYIKRALEWLKEPFGNHEIALSILTVSSLPVAAAEIIDEANQILEEYPGDITTWSEDGEPAQKILEVAEHDNVDMIVLGAYGQTRVRELILGSVTEEVIRQTKLPVLCFR